ncbi:hypothetical protein [Sporosarcina sp. A2]|uniref:hypothetical protein n=1 Tax=Sporosarcina sp. A2 TaxID=3393449 RepID=UPI003D7A74EE
MIKSRELNSHDLFYRDIKVAFKSLVESHYAGDRMIEIIQSGLFEPHEADGFLYNKDGSAYNPELDRWFYSNVTFAAYYKTAKAQL